MRVHLGSDHAAIDLRRELAAAVAAFGHEVASETGPSAASESVDYPDVAVAVSGRVKADPGSLGLLVCGTGQGMAMAANKQAGIRAAVVMDPFSAAMAREHNDANVLCLGARVVGVELAKVLLRTFLDARFAGGRHARRVEKLEPGG
ncbi:ribose 5-phosphate isomerase B [Nannocystis punicea]|uniref:Ribose 5-phosphate isomerase B n=1 Tax=Nannocystis punicea TaxID=2995304 RepID=A0ABY7HF32_9BACT|nr:ribose 5-phosphate isomerase B [Nannocystis poenicansa]WAS97685.1 ribose 5-phosphate isomerase B [Nannocystis poenicansa]